ncbi:hypothetical protein GOQ27_03705 [Clostridium sp. D2Q-11]|uniref:Uncharacterized protein n=1 Tax=Anaeromonas frigoriresistens TaxID=2683708 RepID=A0A942UXR0_9FIRM|nr:hypothetical protein [Anaeromonas frigoriresistens]MBS4537552.1 hypothetical protein [Anaeromonas frigoriresistens]
MKRYYEILLLIKNIILHPRKTSYSKDLVDYDKKIMKIYYIISSIIYSLSLNILLAEGEHSLIKFVLKILFGIGLALLGKKIFIRIYMNIINRSLLYNIPLNIGERIITPYILVYIILSALSFTIAEFNILISIYSYPILILWLNIQVYYVAKYRIEKKEMDKSTLQSISKRLVYLSIITIMTALLNNSFSIGRPFERTQLNYENPIIRESTYKLSLDIYKEVEDNIKNEQGISDIQKDEMHKRFSHLTFELTHLRRNERKLIGSVLDTVDMSNEWYHAKLTSDEEQMEVKMEKYEELKEKAQTLFETFEVGE